MKAFDPNYKLLDEMYQDEYYPDFLVDKVKEELQKVIRLLESGETDIGAVQKTLEEYGQRCRNGNLEDMDVDRWRRVSAALGIPTSGELAPVLERFRKSAQRQPLYQCMFHEDDGSLTESYGLMFE